MRTRCGSRTRRHLFLRQAARQRGLTGHGGSQGDRTLRIRLARRDCAPARNPGEPATRIERAAFPVRRGRTTLSASLAMKAGGKRTSVPREGVEPPPEPGLNRLPLPLGHRGANWDSNPRSRDHDSAASRFAKPRTRTADGSRTRYSTLEEWHVTVDTPAAQCLSPVRPTEPFTYAGGFVAYLRHVGHKRRPCRDRTGSLRAENAASSPFLQRPIGTAARIERATSGTSRRRSTF